MIAKYNQNQFLIIINNIKNISKFEKCSAGKYEDL